MIRKIYIQLYVLLVAVVCALVLYGCANRGVGPQGGPKDETPPVIKKATPENGTVDFAGEEIVLQFDEYVVLQDVANQVLMSPPQLKAPVVRAVGKKVMVEFEEELRDSTTYTILFGNAICDNNEKNPLENYSFSFSTGPIIDSLEMSGVVIDAHTLNPMANVLVGVHANLSDTALSTLPFRHVARTNEDGEFHIKNMAPGTYHLFALNDNSKDFLYQPGEGLAFLDTLFVPEVHEVLVVDTLWTVHQDTIRMDSLTNDSIRVDSVMELQERMAAEYYPQGVLLRYFEEDKQRHYFQRCKREEQHSFVLTFAAPQDEAPVFAWNYEDPVDSVLVNPDSVVVRPYLDPAAFIVQANPTNDTIVVWITDSAVMRHDTLPFLMTYMFTDSLYNLVPRTDTLAAIYHAPKITQKAKDALARQKKNAKLEWKSNATPTFEIYNPLIISFTTPLAAWENDSIHVYEMKDTVRVPLQIHFVKRDSSGMKLALYHDWKPETTYELHTDSAAFTDIYGLSSDKQKASWKIRAVEEYSSLVIKVEPYDPEMMIEILSEKDQPVRSLRAKEKGAKFEYLKPDPYYVRIYKDQNGDSLWTTGDYLKHIQPEPVYYFPSKLTLRANWDFEETVNYLSTSVLEQKPEEIRKADTKKKK